MSARRFIIEARRLGALGRGTDTFVAQSLEAAVGALGEKGRELPGVCAPCLRSAHLLQAVGFRIRSKGYEILSSAFSENLMVSFSNGRVFTRGYEFMIKDMDRDLEIGAKTHPKEVISSKDVAVIECDLESPPEDPHHCPPAISQVAVYREGKIHRLHWYLPPRPVREGNWEETLPPAAEG